MHIYIYIFTSGHETFQDSPTKTDFQARQQTSLRRLQGGDFLDDSQCVNVCPDGKYPDHLASRMAFSVFTSSPPRWKGGGWGWGRRCLKKFDGSLTSPSKFRCNFVVGCFLFLKSVPVCHCDLCPGFTP